MYNKACALISNFSNHKQNAIESLAEQEPRFQQQQDLLQVVGLCVDIVRGIASDGLITRSGSGKSECNHEANEENLSIQKQLFSE